MKFRNQLVIQLSASLMLLFTQFIQAQNFELVNNTPFFDVSYGASAFSDIDNDGDQDFLMIGDRSESSLPQNENYIAKLYENDGSGNFSEILGTPFIGLEQASIAFADVDGDNDEDVMIIGIDFLFDPYTRLYLNDGNGNFTVAPTSQFTNVYAGDIVFADVDGDQDLDVFLSGSSVGFQNVSHTGLYINDGTGVFVEQANTPFANAQDGSIDVADFDLDGDLDLLLLGTSEVPGPITEAYLNDGSGNYTTTNNSSFEQLSSGDLHFSDVDNDGDEDVLIAGTSDGGLTPYTGLYINDGLGNFVVQQNSSIVNLKFVSSMFFDFDNDGDEDLLMTGKNSVDPNLFVAAGKETHLYANDGNGVFEEVVNQPFPSMDFGHLASADVNGDNFEDVFIMGNVDQGVTFYSELYLNTKLLSAIGEVGYESVKPFTVYPNPVTGGTLYLQLNDKKLSKENLLVVDMLGRIVKVSSTEVEDNVWVLDISLLNNGIYYVSFDSRFGSVSQKISVFN